MHVHDEILKRIEAHLVLLIDKVNRIENWIDERTPPDPPQQPEADIYCEMVKKRVGMGRGCSCTTETGCMYYGDRTHLYPRRTETGRIYIHAERNTREHPFPDAS